MTHAHEDTVDLGPASPFLIVADVPRSIAFYTQTLGFECRFRFPDADPFFAVVGRGSAQMFVKHVDDAVLPLPNRRRHRDALWDAYVFTPDPDALAEEIRARPATPHVTVVDRDDGLRGFEVTDPDGYVLFFGRPV